MDGASRRQQLLKILSDSRNPVSGGELAKELQVSRQVIVQDIALLSNPHNKLALFQFQQYGLEFFYV